MAEFADRVIAAFAAGQQLKQQRDETARRRQLEDEDRKIERDALALRRKQMDFEDRVKRFQLQRGSAQEQFEALSGAPAADLTPEMTDGGVLPARAAVAPGMNEDSPDIATADPTDQTLVTRQAPVVFPGLDELGIPGFERRPPTREQGIADVLQERMMKARVDSATRAARLQRFEGIRNGQRQFFNYDPETGAVFDLRGNEAPDVQPPPKPTSTRTGTTATSQTNARLTRQQQVKDFRAALTAALAQQAPADVLARLEQQAESLKLTWDDEKRVGDVNAAAQRLKAARGGQLLETVPRSPLTGKPAEDPSQARSRRMTAGNQILRGDEPEAGEVATRAEVEAIAQMWRVSYAEAKRRVEASGKRVIE